MEIPVKLLVTGALGCAIAGGMIEHQFNAREVIKTVTVDHEVTRNHIVTVTHEQSSPDGTKTIDSKTTDNSDKTTDVVQKIVDAKASQIPTWMIAASGNVDADGMKTYGVSVDKRLLGPLTVGAFIDTKINGGLRIGVMF